MVRFPQFKAVQSEKGVHFLCAQFGWWEWHCWTMYLTEYRVCYWNLLPNILASCTSREITVCFWFLCQYHISTMEEFMNNAFSVDVRLLCNITQNGPLNISLRFLLLIRNVCRLIELACKAFLNMIRKLFLHLLLSALFLLSLVHLLSYSPLMRARFLFPFF